MSRRRASLSSQRSSIHTSTATFVDDALFHVSQRLDALAADDEHAFLYFSRVVTPPLRSSTADTNANNPITNYGDANTNIFTTTNATTDSSSDNISASHRYGYHNYHHHHHHQQTVPPPRMRTATITTRRRRRKRQALVARVLGLSAFYARFALLIGTGWFLTAYAVLATTLVLHDSPSAVRLALSSSAATISAMNSVDTQRGRELAALAIGAALGGPLCGSLADHYGRRRVLLLATATWIVGHIASAFAWSHAALLATRALSGLGLGGQVALFSIVLSEFAAQRRRGRIVVMAMACAPLGALTAVHTAQRLVDLVRWRVFTAAIVGGAGVVYLVALAVFLHDSPRFLAASGRTDAAMALVEAIEHAHGINRNARVTMPSSLYEPPAQLQHQQPSNQHSQRHGSRASRLSSSTRRPPASYGPVPFPRRLTNHSLPQTHTHTPYQTQMQRPRRRMSVALTPGMVSIGVSLGKRWQRVLGCRPYAWRSLGLALLWLCVSLGLSTAVACAARFSRRKSSSSESEHAPSMTLLLVVVPSCVTLAAFVGLLLSALLIDRCGRVPLVLVSVLVSSLATTMLGMHLFLALDGVAFLAASCSLLALAGVVALSTATVWTLECFGVLIRATGMGLVFCASCVGIALGQWLAWSDALLKMESCVHFVLWGVAAAFLVVALVVWLCGVETRGLEDVDSVVIPPATAETTTGGHRVSTLQEQRHSTTSSDKHAPPPPPSLPPLPPPMASKSASDHHHDDDQCTETTDEQDDPCPNQNQIQTVREPSSDASTSIGSSTISRSSSTVRFSSQRTLSSRGTRGSSLTRQQQQNQQNQQHNQQRGHPDTHRASSPSPSFAARRRESSSSSSASPSPYLAGMALRRSSATLATPPFVIRRSSLTRQQQHQQDEDGDHATVRIVRPVRRAREPSSSFGSGRLTFADLPHSRLAARLDPHSVREQHGRRSSQDESSILSSTRSRSRSRIRSSSSSSSSSDRLGVGPEHDMLTIEIDPYDDQHGFVTMHTPVPMLG